MMRTLSRLPAAEAPSQTHIDTQTTETDALKQERRAFYTGTHKTIAPFTLVFLLQSWRAFSGNLIKPLCDSFLQELAAAIYM